MTQIDTGYSLSRNRIIISAIVIFLSVVASIAFGSYTILFFGILIVLLFLIVAIYAENSKKTTDALVAILSKLNGQPISNNAQLREVEVNGVTIKVSDEDYIKLLEAKVKS